MLNKKIADLLNDQINKEFYSAYLYLDMNNYFEARGLDGKSAATPCCSINISRTTTAKSPLVPSHSPTRSSNATWMCSRQVSLTKSM